MGKIIIVEESFLRNAAILLVAMGRLIEEEMDISVEDISVETVSKEKTEFSTK